MILITNNGIFCNGWNKQPDTLIEKDINHYYSDSVLFSDDLTIGGFFQVFFKKNKKPRPAFRTGPDSRI